MSDSFLVEAEDLGRESHLAGPSEDTESLLDQLIDIVSAAKSMPLSSSVMVAREEVLELLERAREQLPDEIHLSRRMLREREDYLVATRRDGEEILAEARVQAERMVQRTEIVRQATQRARRILEEAEAESRRLRREADDFVDQKLGNFEIVLDRTLRMVRAGREKLSFTPFTSSPGNDLSDARPDDDEAAGSDDALFDQDIS